MTSTLSKKAVIGAINGEGGEKLPDGTLRPDRFLRGDIGLVQRLRMRIVVLGDVQWQRLFDVAHDAHTAGIRVESDRPIGFGRFLRQRLDRLLRHEGIIAARGQHRIDQIIPQTLIEQGGPLASDEEGVRVVQRLRLDGDRLQFRGGFQARFAARTTPDA